MFANVNKKNLVSLISVGQFRDHQLSAASRQFHLLADNKNNNNNKSTGFLWRSLPFAIDNNNFSTKVKGHYRLSTIETLSSKAMSTISSTIIPAGRVREAEPSIWTEFGALLLQEKPLNLGQGCPDYAEAAPSHIKDNLIKAAQGNNHMLNQYTRGFGHPRLVKVLSELYSKLLGHPVDPMKEILVTIGAYESLYCIINAFIDEGDEAIILEPYFDCYSPMVNLAGGKCRFVPLRLSKDPNSNRTTNSADFKLDINELKQSISEKTKLIILNTPHNPIGKVFSKNELEALAEVCKQYNLLVISDEVYEHLVIDGEHVRIASLQGMWDRTITVGSVGKTFSVTGWKLGWCYGPEQLIKYVQLYHQNCIYVCPTITQEAVAESFEIEIPKMGTPESYWSQLAKSLGKKRDKMAESLLKANIEPVIPEGGYFMMANTSEISKKVDYQSEQGSTKDHKLARWLSKNKKLQGIPPSAFYSSDHQKLAEDFIRLCYFKKDSTLEEADKLIRNL